MVNPTDSTALRHVELALPHDPRAVGTARRVVADEIARASAQWPHLGALLDPVDRVIDEMVTDALGRCGHVLAVHLEVDTDRVEVGVVDDPPAATGRPERAPGTDDPFGRLEVVRSVASAWGVRMLPNRRWRWARVDLRRRSR